MNTYDFLQKLESHMQALYNEDTSLQDLQTRRERWSKIIDISDAINRLTCLFLDNPDLLPKEDMEHEI